MNRRAAAVVRPARAFTLIELILVLAIIATLAAVVAPSLSGLRSRTRIDSAARMLTAMLNEARSRAVVEANPHRVWIDTDEHACWLEAMGAEGFARPEASFAQKQPLDPIFSLDPRDSASRSTAAIAEPGGFAVRFEPDGRGEDVVITILGQHGAERVIYRPSATEPYRVFDPNRPDELGEGVPLARR